MMIVALAWIYVVGLMALTEPSVVAGIMTFFGYCVLPLSLVWYVFGRKRRATRPSEPDRVPAVIPADAGIHTEQAASVPSSTPPTSDGFPPARE